MLSVPLKDMDWKPFSFEVDEPPVWLFVSAKEWAAYLEASPNKCDHVKTELRVQQTANGTEQWKKQCLKCGRSVGQAKSQSSSPRPVDWDDSAEKIWEDICDQRRDEMAAFFLKRTAELEDGSEQTYQEYLASEDWRAKRLLVLERDSYICQGCLKRTATEVHHLSYEDVPNELLYDLVSVCGDCHEFIHRKKIEKRAKLERFGKT